MPDGLNWRAEAPAVAVVVPCYRSESTVGLLADRLAAAFEKEGSSWRLVLVDDGSPDKTWDALLEVKRRHGERIRAVRLARNVGQHSAIICGLESVPPEATLVVTMDDDLQHCPEDVPFLLSKLRSGADIAIGAFPDKQHARWRNVGGRLVDYVLRNLFRLPPSFQLTSFRAFRRFVVEDVVSQRSTYVYLTASILASSTRVANVPVRHEPRHTGHSGYNLTRSLILDSNL